MYTRSDIYAIKYEIQIKAILLKECIARVVVLCLQEEDGSAVTAKMATRRRGRKPAKFDSKLKLERSQQSARECRARKKLRYQYLEELVASREKAIIVLRKELDAVMHCCIIKQQQMLAFSYQQSFYHSANLCVTLND